jgi:hypothetical protein
MRMSEVVEGYFPY